MERRRQHMNLDALVKAGSRPWAPSADARELDVWHEYDVPTAGTFMLRADPVLFTVLGSPDERITVWAYICLTGPDAKELADQRFSSAADMMHAIESRFIGHQAVFAVADDLHIWKWSPTEVKGSLVATATEFLSQVREALESKKAPDDEFEVKLAGVAAAKRELISA
jgi:hypothetical protein